MAVFRKSFRRRSFRRRTRRGGKLRAPVRRTVRSMIQKATRGDLNVSYVTISGQAIPVGAGANAYTVKLFQVGSGTTEGTRVSNRCVLRRMDFRFWISGDDTDLNQVSPTPKVRVVMVQDNMSDGDPILWSMLSANGGADEVWLCENMPKWNAPKGRFKILHDRVFSLDGKAQFIDYTAGTGAEVGFIQAETGIINYSKSFGKDGLLIQYDSTASTDNTGAMVYVFFASQTATMVVNGFCRSIFHE